MNKEDASIGQRISVLMAKLGLKSKEKFAKRINFSRTQIYYYEKWPDEGGTEPSPNFLNALAELENELGIGSEQNGSSQEVDRLNKLLSETERELKQAKLALQQNHSPILSDDEVDYKVGSNKCRMIPVLGSAHAGEPTMYEQIPDDWQDWIPTECRDPQAFASMVVGESMTGGRSSVLDGDLIIHMPSETAHSGSLVAVCFEDGSILVRDMQEIDEESVRLIPRNPQWEPTVHHKSTIRWMHPVWGQWRQIWK